LRAKRIKAGSLFVPGYSEMPRKDPAARREYQTGYMRRRYNADAEFRAVIKARTDTNCIRYRKEKLKLLAQFRANGCMLCGEMTNCCLAAHHRDPSEKKFALGNHVGNRSVMPEKFALELAKCVCLCHNCHAKVHAGVAEPLWSIGDEHQQSESRQSFDSL
jgi:hypothetical protein